METLREIAFGLVISFLPMKWIFNICVTLAGGFLAMVGVFGVIVFLCVLFGGKKDDSDPSA